MNLDISTACTIDPKAVLVFKTFRTRNTTFIFNIFYENKHDPGVQQDKVYERQQNYSTYLSFQLYHLLQFPGIDYFKFLITVNSRCKELKI